MDDSFNFLIISISPRLQDSTGSERSLRAASNMLLLVALALALTPYSLSLAYASPCSAQLGFPIILLSSSNQAFTAVVPVSATCSTAYGQQLYASASASDLNTGTSASTVNTILTSVDGGYTFTGQVGLSLPPSTVGHWIQLTVTIYQNPSGSQLTTVGEAFPVNASNGQVVTATVTEQTPNQFAPAAPPQPGHYIFAYVAIAAILACVIIVTVGLLVYSRRSAGYYQAPRTY
jgi:hypothetical protein